MAIDRTALAEFLRRRRESLQPEDVGLPRGQRRRTAGLRREEVALLSHMSTDYYSRIEQERGPQPSEQMIAAIAQGLHLSLDERDHVLRLAGHQPTDRGSSSEHISPGMLRIFDRLHDTPAEIVTELGETCGRLRSASRWSVIWPRSRDRHAASATAGSPTQRRVRATRSRITPSSRACSPPACAG